MSLPCVILAGGLGTRMAAYTRAAPKALIPVHDQPFVYYQLRWLRRCGVPRVTLSLGHMGDQIEAYVRSRDDWGLEVRFVHEGPELRGTGGALRIALDAGALDTHFFLLYGDSFLPIEFGPVAEAFTQSLCPALMTVFKNSGSFDRSNAHFENDRVVFYSKRTPWTQPLTYIDYGLSVLSRELIDRFYRPGVKADLADLFETLSGEGRLAGFEVRERFFEIGSPQGLQDFSDYISRQLTRF